MSVLCVNCAHLQERHGGTVDVGMMTFTVAGSTTCAAAKTLKLDVVSGAMGHVSDYSPYACRGSELLCGAEGKWFQIKPEHTKP